VVSPMSRCSQQLPTGCFKSRNCDAKQDGGNEGHMVQAPAWQREILVEQSGGDRIRSNWVSCSRPPARGAAATAAANSPERGKLAVSVPLYRSFTRSSPRFAARLPS
jgi:hypothetical protein